MIVASGFKGLAARGRGRPLRPSRRARAAVVGVTDPYRGESVKAVVSLKPGSFATGDELKAWCQSKMALQAPHVGRDRRRIA